MAEPTPTELKLLQKFRQNIKDVVLKEEQLEDMFLLSWIRARENDLKEAEDMLRKSLHWRRTRDMDNISKWVPPAYYSTAYRFHFCGHDNKGRAVLFVPYGTWDARKVVESKERETFIRFMDQSTERVVKEGREAKNETGGSHWQFVIIFDMKGYALRQLMSRSTVEAILAEFRSFEANYPESLKTVFVVNAPIIFPMAYELIKPILSQRTRNKVRIFNSNIAKWRPVLLETIPETTLQNAFTKNCISSNELSNETDKYNGLLIEKCVEAGGKFEVKFYVKHAHSILRWNFETVDYDIGFAVLFESIEIHLYERMNSHLEKVEGSVVCQASGTYTLRFDNSYSRMRSKTLRYSATLIENDEDETDKNHN